MNIVILNRQRSLCEGDWEIVKRLVDMDCNKHVHGSNTRILSIWLSLSQTSKNTILSSYILCFLFNNIGEQEGRIDSVQKQGWERGRWPKQCINNVYMCE
jgi:hypothetical protein